VGRELAVGDRGACLACEAVVSKGTSRRLTHFCQRPIATSPLSRERAQQDDTPSTPSALLTTASQARHAPQSSRDLLLAIRFARHPSLANWRAISWLNGNSKSRHFRFKWSRQPTRLTSGLFHPVAYTNTDSLNIFGREIAAMHDHISGSFHRVEYVLHPLLPG
jgi:hypothetical protein